MEKKLNIFVKSKKNTQTNKNFNIYLTKDRNDNCYEVRFTQDCENLNMLPKDKHAFVCVTDTNKMSSTVKTNIVDNREYKKNILYIKKIVRIEEYIEPEFDASDFE